MVPLSKKWFACGMVIVEIFTCEGVKDMQNVRLKTSLHPQQIDNRLLYNPEIIELHLKEENLYKPEEILENIHALKSKGVRVYLHHPTTYKGKYLDIISSDCKMRDFYDWSSKELAAICKKENIKCIIHCHYVRSESSDFGDQAARDETRKRIEEILRINDQCFLWEDSIKGIFSAENPFLLSEIIKPLNLPLNIDISHTFIALKGDNQRLQKNLESFHGFANYFHLVDSMGQSHDALPLGKGNIDWTMVKPYVEKKDFVFEIDLRSSNFLDCGLMIESVEYFNRIKSR